MSLIFEYTFTRSLLRKRKIVDELLIQCTYIDTFLYFNN